MRYLGVVLCGVIAAFNGLLVAFDGEGLLNVVSAMWALAMGVLAYRLVKS